MYAIILVKKGKDLYMIKQIVKNSYKEYLSQSSINNTDGIYLHENEHDNSGGHPNYHNDTHDNTPEPPKSQNISEINQKENRKSQLIKLYLSKLTIKNLSSRINKESNSDNQHNKESKLTLKRNETN